MQLEFEAVNSLNLAVNGGLRSTFANDSALLPSDVIDFAMVPAQRFLRETTGNSFIVRCFVTSR